MKEDEPCEVPFFVSKCLKMKYQSLFRSFPQERSSKYWIRTGPCWIGCIGEQFWFGNRECVDYQLTQGRKQWTTIINRFALVTKHIGSWAGEKVRVCDIFDNVCETWGRDALTGKYMRIFRDRWGPGKKVRGRVVAETKQGDVWTDAVIM